MSKSNARLVYSSDGSHGKPCKKCKESPCICPQDIEIKEEEVTLRLRIEKKGRGGKQVTVIYELPHNPGYFKNLAKKLKSHCGTGGSFKDSTIEIQGDQRNKIQKYLESLGFNVTPSGG